MQHVPAALRAIHDVVFDDDSGGTFVVVNAPASVAPRLDVVDQIAADDGARRHTERVDATHVAEKASPYVVNVVQLDDVVAAHVGCVAPNPAHRYPRIVEVV